jgi:hypothetical protein
MGSIVPTGFAPEKLGLGINFTLVSEKPSYPSSD